LFFGNQPHVWEIEKELLVGRARIPRSFLTRLNGVGKQTLDFIPKYFGDQDVRRRYKCPKCQRDI